MRDVLDNMAEIAGELSFHDMAGEFEILVSQADEAAFYTAAHVTVLSHHRSPAVTPYRLRSRGSHSFTVLSGK